MYYTINVSKSGAFYFNTGDSFKYRTEAFDAYNELKSKFPQEDGYEVSVRKYETTCAEVDFKVVSYDIHQFDLQWHIHDSNGKHIETFDEKANAEVLLNFLNRRLQEK